MGYYHTYNEDWIKENYLNYPSYEKLAIDHNKLFGTSITTSAMKRHCSNIGLKKPRMHEEFTKEQHKWLQENYPLLGVRETQKQFNKKFNANRTYHSIKNYGHNHSIVVKDDVATKNKLREVHYNPNSKRHIKEAGYMRIECGRWVIKKEDGTWDFASRVIYENEYGNIPKDYDVIFLDGDINNLSVDNLLAIPKKYSGLLLQYNLRSSNADITRTGITWCDLYQLLKAEDIHIDTD